MHKFRWKFNPTKCVFGVPSGKLLGFIVSHRGNEASLENINAIVAMDVQKLTGCMAALNRSLSRLGEQGSPFFKLLKRQDKFQWTPEVAEALENLMQHLHSPPILTAPLLGEELLLYITAATHIISTTIMVERPD